MMKKNTKIIILTLLALFLLILAPWMDNQAIHDRVFQEKAHKDGTMGWVIQPDGTREYTLICDYNVMWFPFGRWVASCEGGYFVTFWGKII
jgi:hypothetical protein